jgi:hypothetical protein
MPTQIGLYVTKRKRSASIYKRTVPCIGIEEKTDASGIWKVNGVLATKKAPTYNSTLDISENSKSLLDTAFFLSWRDL